MSGEEIDRSILGQLQMLAERSSTPGLLAELIASYRSIADARLPELRQAASASDAVTLERVAHLLAGTAANIGLPAVARSARSVELAARDGNTAVEAMLAELESAHAAGLAALQRAVTG
jgi:HPt (histidine-containing phosphotransfer) domain-containing protein